MTLKSEINSLKTYTVELNIRASNSNSLVQNCRELILAFFFLLA
jgi:hypothetical protein